MTIESLLKCELNCSSVKSFGGGGGGCISSGAGFIVDGKKVFVKYNSKPGSNIMLDGEYASLVHLNETNTVKVPTPIKSFSKGSESYLVLEYLEMNGLDKYAAELGEKLAALHLHNVNLKKKSLKNSSYVGQSGEYVGKFGFDVATCCGFIPQQNDWMEDWVEFYAQNRLLYQVKRLERNCGDRDLLKLWPQVERNITKLFPSDLEVFPSLLHGDLWGGNAAETQNEPCIFDPASSYGHSEFELSISHMFGGFPSKFFTAYHKLIPKTPGFEKRQVLYKLYHYLNHWNHFGSGYKGTSISLMKQLVEI